MNRVPGTPRIRLKTGTSERGADIAELIRAIDAFQGIWSKVYTDALRELAITPVQCQLLRRLAEFGPNTVPRLAQQMGVSRQACRETTNRLIHRQCAARQRNSLHKRSAVIVVTPTGRHIVSQIREIWTRWVQHGVAVDAADLALCKDVIEKLTRHIAQHNSTASTHRR